MGSAIDLCMDMINDVTGLREPGAVELLSRHPTVTVVLMHARNSVARAETTPRPCGDLIPEIRSYFNRRIHELTTHGVARGRNRPRPRLGCHTTGT